MDQAALGGHDFEPFCKVLVDTLNHHQVVVVAREDVAIDM
jgi:hypothetical protein